VLYSILAVHIIYWSLAKAGSSDSSALPDIFILKILLSFLLDAPQAASNSSVAITKTPLYSCCPRMPRNIMENGVYRMATYLGGQDGPVRNKFPTASLLYFSAYQGKTSYCFPTFLITLFPSWLVS